MKTAILGVHIDNLSMQEVIAKIEQMLATGNKHYIVTPNPEFLVLAQQDNAFKNILNYADLAIADGVGLLYAAHFLGRQLQRATGVDLMWHACQLATQQDASIYLLGGANNVARQAADVLLQNIPNLKIVGAEDGGQINQDGIPKDSHLIYRINQARPDILFVAFGHGKQEKFIFKHLNQFNTIKVAAGIGGSFDYIAGIVKRAPQTMQNLGLEWLYRLIKQPKRWRRIADAVIIFPLLVFKEKYSKKNG